MIRRLLFLFWTVIVSSEEQPFIDLKKVIRGALDVVAAMPTSTPSFGFGQAISPSQTQPAVPVVDPIVQQKLSRIFHIPPDFVHRLAAQTGYIDYDPTTTVRPRSSIPINPAMHMPLITNSYGDSSFVQEVPGNAVFSTNDFSSAVRENNNIVDVHQYQKDFSNPQAVYFQPITKDGQVLASSRNLYYQPFGMISQPLQPQIIVYGGRTYMAMPNQSHQTAASEQSQLLVTNKDYNEQMKSERNYAEYVKAAEDAQLRASQLQKASILDTSPVEIPTGESKPTIRAPLPYKKTYNLEELAEYYGLQPTKQQQQQQQQQQIKMKTDENAFIQKPIKTKDEYKNEEDAEVVSERISDNVQDTVTVSSPFRQLQINRMPPVSLPPKASVLDIEEKKNTSPHTSTYQGNLSEGDRHIQSQSREEVSTELNQINEEERALNAQRILALRRQMAADRKRFAERKRLLSSMKRKVSKTRSTNDDESFRRHCYNIRSFARQFGVLDIKEYAIANCAFIEQYYPDLKCGEVENFVAHCLRLFQQEDYSFSRQPQ